MDSRHTKLDLAVIERPLAMHQGPLGVLVEASLAERPQHLLTLLQARGQLDISVNEDISKCDDAAKLTYSCSKLLVSLGKLRERFSCDFELTLDHPTRSCSAGSTHGSRGSA